MVDLAVQENVSTIVMEDLKNIRKTGGDILNLTAIIYSISIFISYFILMVILPSIILKSKVKKESIFKRFMVYIIFGNFYISTIVFILSYLNIFNKLSLILSLIIISIFLILLFNKNNIEKKYILTRKIIRELILGEYGISLFLKRLMKKAMKKIKKIYYELFSGRKIEWIIFLSILAYNLYQYGINSMHFTTYLAPDEEIHLYWVQSLIKGNIYPSGVYPHVFHNIIAALIEIFNFQGMILIRYFAITSSILIITMLYFGLRKIFSTKYPALLGLMLYSIIDLYFEQVTYRFQFSIPQEYGMIMLIPMALFLIDYIKDKKIIDLILFTLSLSLSLGIHFYTGIIGIILAFSIGIIYLYKIIKERLFWKLILCSILSAILALAPLGIGLALGHEMEQSFDWASDVIKGEIYSENSDVELDKELNKIEENSKNKMQRALEDIKIDMEKNVVHKIEIFYIFVIIIIFTIIFNFIYMFYNKGDEKNIYQIAFALNNLILIILMLFRSLNLPTIMETKRLAIYFAYFNSIFMGMPIEILYKLIRNTRLKKFWSIISYGLIILSLTLILKYNLLRPIPPFYYFQTNGTMKVNLKIINEYQDYTWTSISPVNNISAIMKNGYHYELDDFIIEQENWNKKKQIKIPTEYVFIYIEKRPIIKFGFRFYRNDIELYKRDTINRESALKDLSDNVIENYHYEKERDILMSKAYYWVKEYKKFFPKEVELYHEDNELIVYKIKQNIYALNNFSIDYKLNSR